MADRPDIPDDPLLVEQATDISGGAQDFGATHLIPQGKTNYLLNIETTFDGQRQKRRGVLARGSVGGSDNPNGAFPFEDGLQDFKHIVVQQGTKLWSSDGLSQSLIPRATTQSLYDTIHYAVQGQAWPASNPESTLFIASAVPYTANTSLPHDKLFSLNRSWGSTTISNVWPRAISWYQKRLWGFNSGVHGQDILAWSNVLDGQDWSNGQNLAIDPDSGDPGTALIPLRGDTPRLLCLKERSIHLLDILWDTDGFYPSSANVLDFANGAKLRPVVTETGCVATRGLTWVPGIQGGDLLFLSREGVRSLNRSATDAQGGAGLPLSWPIQKTIDRINWARADQAVASFWNNIAYFAVPIDGAENNNFVIAHNVPRNSWYYLDWDVNAFIKSQVDPARKFFFFGQTQGTDGQSGVTNGHHLYETYRGQVDPFQAAIIYEEQTRGFTFSQGDDAAEGLRNKKIWRWMEIRARGAATAATMSLQYKVDDANEWVTFRDFSVDPADSFPVLPVQLPFSLDSGRIVRKNLSLHRIPTGSKIQFRFVDDTSFGRIDILEMNIRATMLQETFS
jgi:hypothetical protein